MEIDMLVESLLISAITESREWKRIDRKWVKIENVKVKESIKNRFPETNIRWWKKEYARFRHRDGSVVEVHRFVNTNNQTEEYGVKIKWMHVNEEIEKLIAVALNKPE